MATVMLPLDAVSGTPSYSAQQTRQAFSALAGPAPAGRPLGARSGVRLGTPTSTATLSGAGSTTWNVAAHAGVLDTQTAAAAGPYFYATDGSDTGAITAANATNPRIDILYMKVNDNIQDGSGLLSGQVLYLAGTAAGSPVQPATPARGMAIARINVPTSGGGTPSITWIAPTFYPDTLLVQTGSTTATWSNLSSGGLTTVNITFPTPYATPPTYVSAVITGRVSGDQWVTVRLVDSITTTGARINVFNSGTSTTSCTNLPLSWVAVGAP